MIDLTSFDQPLSNIMDLQFLHGYQEPTILLLYEPVQTSAGYESNYLEYFFPNSLIETTFRAICILMHVSQTYI